MDITKDLIPKGQGVRTGKKLTKCMGLVIHWIGVNQPSGAVIRGNFARSQCGTQYISDWNTGEIIQCVPEDEVCYHVGASKGFSYSALKKRLCGSGNPNWYFVGIECCISPLDKPPGDYAAVGKHMELGRPSEAQYAALVEFAADFLARYGLTVDSLYLHNDITDKACHVWFVKDRARWAQFKAEVKAVMEGEKDMPKEEIERMIAEGVTRGIAAYEDAVIEAQNRAVSTWAAALWDKATAKGVFDGTKPTAPMTREQAAVVLDRLGLLG